MATQTDSGVLPQGAGGWFSRRFGELSAVVLLVVAVALTLILISYDPSDPSLNNAGDGSVSNILGAGGAYAADFFVQSFGIVAYIVPLILFAWVVRLLFHHAIDPFWLRLAAIPAGLFLLSVAANALPPWEGWALSTGLGGAVGLLLSEHGETLLGLDPSTLGLVIALPGILMTLYAAQITWRTIGGFFSAITSILAGRRQRRPGAQAHEPQDIQRVTKDKRRGRQEKRRREPEIRAEPQIATAATLDEPLEAADEPVPAATLRALADEDGEDAGEQRRREEIEQARRRKAEQLARARRKQDEEDAAAEEARRLAEEERRLEEERREREARRREKLGLGRGRGMDPDERQEPTLVSARQLPEEPPARPTAPPAADSDPQATDAAPQARVAPRPAEPRRIVRTGGSTAASSDYEPPPLDILGSGRGGAGDSGESDELLRRNADRLVGVLSDFGVKGEIKQIVPGPVVTRYELEPAAGTKTSRVIGLADDIARSMSALSVRVAVVAGSTKIGIELPNKKRQTVFLRDLLSAKSYSAGKERLPLTLGQDIAGVAQIVDLARMPHLLVAGTTGSGKSVAINAMILSLLYRLSPEQCRLIMVDPKMLELSVYDGIPHLLTPVVTDPKLAVMALKWVVQEMEERYRKMSHLGVRNIDGYNARISEALANGETLSRRVQTGFDTDTGQPVYEQQPLDQTPLAYIVVVVDEMADLMLVAGKDIEAAVQRLAQMARAAGIHLIMATQRPSVDVITGTIKANFPTRISFHVTSKIDSRTILGEQGAEQLLGQGDMLFMGSGGRITRIHGPLVTDGEVEAAVKHLSHQGPADYQPDVIGAEDEGGGLSGDAFDGGDESDELYNKAVNIIVEHRKASTSFIQRQLKIGYNRAANLVERMEADGLVSPANHVGKREVLIGKE